MGATVSSKTDWDVIVVGTGMGGATLGHALARGGRRVLFLEKGRSARSGDCLRGAYAETFFEFPEAPRGRHRETLARAGRYFEPLEDGSGKRAHSFIPLMGAGTGGSSALYGMAMERLFPEDFHPASNFPDAPEASLVERWPIEYEALLPYYERAERLYRVRGAADPLKPAGSAATLLPPPDPCPANRELYEFFSSRGLHPYQLPLACEYVDGCEECQGFLCRKNCKNDSGRICLEPALARYGAEMRDQCPVLRLESRGGSVTGVVCFREGREETFRAGTVVLAAGALETPAILLRSGNPASPRGLANGSGLVGRNLMRHYVDLYAVYPKSAIRATDLTKALAFNDFYQTEGGKLGTVQSFGRLPGAVMLAESLQADLERDFGPLAARLFRPAKPLVRWGLNRLLSRTLILAGIMEDLPYEANRTSPAAGTQGIRIDYALHPSEKRRIGEFRRRVAEALRPYRYVLMKQAENNERIAHACGTCRFGTDPERSVLDPNNRAHEVDNLYVVDSSFFPSSGGTNPSLTIAANALRVADLILSRRSAGQTDERTSNEARQS